jgi:hypothetical protein
MIAKFKRKRRPACIYKFVNIIAVLSNRHGTKIFSMSCVFHLPVVAIDFGEAIQK